MKIVIKTIKGESFPIDVEPSTTVAEVKQTIQRLKEVDAGLMKLIVKGKSASDE